jgi:hypothetical protein
MPAKSERMTLTLPGELMARIRREAAARRVPASQLVAAAVERYLWKLEAEERLDRIEGLVRICVLALLEGYDNPAEARRRLAAEAAEQMRRLAERRVKDGAGVGQSPAAARERAAGAGGLPGPDRPPERPAGSPA